MVVGVASVDAQRAAVGRELVDVEERQPMGREDLLASRREKYEKCSW